jgi:predicted transposase YbfD/YdcC
MDIIKFKEEAGKIKDPRRQYGNLRHKLIDILIIGLMSIISTGQDFDDMVIFGETRKDWLKTFLELPNGIPSGDTFRRVFERINPKELSESLLRWISVPRGQGEVINIDGKTICGSGNAEHKAYHVVSAWACENQITLGQIKTEEKSNEITAIPELLDMLDVTDGIITIDAMGCQKAICEKITDKHADYIIGLKGNQKNLHNAVETHFADFGTNCNKVVTEEKGHGRVEKREYFLETDLSWLSQKEDWCNLISVGMVKSSVLRNGILRLETRYFITSLSQEDDFAYAVRKHWSIENNLHWCLDVVFREDDARARKDNSPLNMNILRKTALTLLKQFDVRKFGLRKKMLNAALDVDALYTIVFGQPQT